MRGRLNEFGFQFPEAFAFLVDFAVEKNGFGYEAFEISVGHKSIGVSSLDFRARTGSFAPALARRRGFYTGFSNPCSNAGHSFFDVLPDDPASRNNFRFSLTTSLCGLAHNLAPAYSAIFP
jgi:hypothetical protein